MRFLRVYEDDTNPVEFLRRKLVYGASQWLSGMHGSKENEKLKFGYNDREWELILSMMDEDGAWDVPSLKDENSNFLKENFAPEMLIRYAAHELRSHIIVIDLQLMKMQLCSANFVRDNNVVFESPLILYATGNHFQSVFQVNHEYFIQLAQQLEREATESSVENFKQLDEGSNSNTPQTQDMSEKETCQEVDPTKHNMSKKRHLKTKHKNKEDTGSISHPDEQKQISNTGCKQLKQNEPGGRKKTPLTPAEKMRRSRASKSEEERDKSKEINRKRMAAKRAALSIEQKQYENLKEKNRKAVKRAGQSKEERIRNDQSKKRKAAKRVNQSEEEKSKEKDKDKIRKTAKRAEQSAEERSILNTKNKKNMTQKRHNAKSGVSPKEAFKSNQIMDGSHTVLDIRDTNDDIGKMITKCQDCHAYKFKKEPPATCCNSGKVILESFPKPPQEINRLWHSNTIKSRVFRENARSINNAVCLSSLKVQNRHFERGFNPSIIFEGKVQQFVGPLQAAVGEQPRFAQIYVHDPKLESSVRFQNMSIPENISTAQKQILKDVLQVVQKALHKHNPFVRDFKQILDIPTEELGEGKLIISAKKRPLGEHERRYNTQTNLQEISILRNSEPHDIVLQQRGGSLQTVSDLNPKGMPLHFTLLFPYGTYGWDLMLKHTDGKRRVTPREFYVFHLNIRDPKKDFLHLAGRLFQEWICMAWVAVEDQKLNFQRQNQKALRADSYKKIKEVTDQRKADLAPREDGMFSDDNHQPAVGRKILSSSFTGSLFISENLFHFVY